MLNQVVLVGRITTDKIEVVETDGGAKKSRIVIAVQRSFKNEEGIYDTDFIEVRLFNGVAENTAEYCKKGDIVGVKGRLQVENNQLVVMAEKLTFLTSKKND